MNRACRERGARAPPADTQARDVVKPRVRERHDRLGVVPRTLYLELDEFFPAVKGFRGRDAEGGRSFIDRPDRRLPYGGFSNRLLDCIRRRRRGDVAGSLPPDRLLRGQFTAVLHQGHADAPPLPGGHEVIVGPDLAPIHGAADLGARHRRSPDISGVDPETARLGRQQHRVVALAVVQHLEVADGPEGAVPDDEGVPAPARRKRQRELAAERPELAGEVSPLEEVVLAAAYRDEDLPGRRRIETRGAFPVERIQRAPQDAAETDRVAGLVDGSIGVDEEDRHL